MNTYTLISLISAVIGLIVSFIQLRKFLKSHSVKDFAGILRMKFEEESKELEKIIKRVKAISGFKNFEIRNVFTKNDSQKVQLFDFYSHLLLPMKLNDDAITIHMVTYQDLNFPTIYLYPQKYHNTLGKLLNKDDIGHALKRSDGYVLLKEIISNNISFPTAGEQLKENSICVICTGNKILIHHFSQCKELTDYRKLLDIGAKINKDLLSVFIDNVQTRDPVKEEILLEDIKTPNNNIFPLVGLWCLPILILTFLSPIAHGNIGAKIGISIFFYIMICGIVIISANTFLNFKWLYRFLMGPKEFRRAWILCHAITWWMFLMLSFSFGLYSHLVYKRENLSEAICMGAISAIPSILGIYLFGLAFMPQGFYEDKYIGSKIYAFINPTSKSQLSLICILVGSFIIAISFIMHGISLNTFGK